MAAGGNAGRFLEAVGSRADLWLMKRTARNGKIRPLKECGGFGKFARASAHWAGTSYAFIVGVLVILCWVVTGPLFHFSDTWQLVINTGTTIVTFLMVFLIQNTQNRDSVAMQLKLDELIRASGGCHNAVLDIEELSEEELEKIKRGYRILAKRALEEVRAGESDLGSPEIRPDRQAPKEKAR